MSLRAWTAGLRGVGPGQETDRWLLLWTLTLVAAGLVMVLSASTALGVLDHHFALYYFLRQVAFAAGGLLVMLALRHVDYHRLERWAPALGAVVLTLMLVALLPRAGVMVNGARRWVTLGPLGTFQPSEAGKLAFTLFVARWVDQRRDRLGSFTDGFLPFAALTGLVLGVLMLQRDMGTALVTCAIVVSVYFAGGGRTRYIALLLAALLVVFVAFTLVESYRAQRVTAFLDPFGDPLGAGFQSTQALLALGSGGLTGVGLGHSVQKYLWLPEAHTDFIFAIVGEETGLVGTTLVLAGFVALAVRGYRAAMRAPDRLGLMLAAGITTWVCFQALINMGTVTDTLPITGLPLPFISYGGTSLAITMAAMGVLLNVASQAERGRHSRRRGDATVDLGRRDWRASLAGSRRRASVPRRASGG